MKYRYRDNAGSTRRSEESFKHLPKIGIPTEVKGYCYKGAYNTRLAVMVKGDKGSARFEALCWGYNGTGPRGLRKLFDILRIPFHIAEYIAHKTSSPDWTKARDYWKLLIMPDGGYRLFVYDENNNVIGHHVYELQEKRTRQLLLAI